MTMSHHLFPSPGLFKSLGQPTPPYIKIEAVAHEAVVIYREPSQPNPGLFQYSQNLFCNVHFKQNYLISMN